jgi:chorismate mutase
MKPSADIIMDVYTSYKSNMVPHTKRNFRVNGLIAAILATMAIGSASAQNDAGRLNPMVRTSARRLAIAEQVALSKWDSGAAVEDSSREAQVIVGAVKAGDAKGIDSASITRFFKAQIEANKVVQYSLLADWRRHGGAPAHTPIDLAGTIRPELDQLQAELVAEMASTKDIRSGGNCRVEMATAIGKYLEAHRKETSQLTEIALDRALSESCIDSTSRSAP